MAFVEMTVKVFDTDNKSREMIDPAYVRAQTANKLHGTLHHDSCKSRKSISSGILR